jgi:beta-alanine degradation protein BauB
MQDEPHHTILLENDYVRVYQVNLKPGESTLLHQHDRDYVVVTLDTSNIRNQRDGEEPKDWEFLEEDTRFVRGGYAHVATNLGDKLYRNITVELKRPVGPVVCEMGCGSRFKADENLPEGEEIPIRTLTLYTATQSFVEFKSANLIVTRHSVLDSTGPHSHSGPHLAVALNDIAFENRIDARPAGNVTLSQGQVAWITSTKEHELVDIDEKTLYECYVTVEFPENGSPVPAN